MKQNILILTEEEDAHADAVIHMLRYMGENPVRAHLLDIYRSVSFRIDVGTNGVSGEFRTLNHTCSFSDFKSVWYRRPCVKVPFQDLLSHEEDFARRELAHSLQGLWALLPGRWLSRPPSIMAASWKPSQLKRAQDMGFRVPRTLITMQPKEAFDFFESCERRMILKPMGWSAFAKLMPGETVFRSLYTTMVTQESLKEHGEYIRNTVCLLQEYIDKAYELRVTVVGEQIFAAEIHTQDHEETRVDSRIWHPKLVYKKAELSKDIHRRCLEFVKSYGLSFGALDLIVTPSGECVFLEINPNGQWLYIQKYVPELRIAESVAEFLACIS